MLKQLSLFTLCCSLPLFGMQEKIISKNQKLIEDVQALINNDQVPTRFAINGVREINLTTHIGQTYYHVKLDPQTTDLLLMLSDPSATQEEKNDALATFQAFYFTRYTKLASLSTSQKKIPVDSAAYLDSKLDKAQILLSLGLAAVQNRSYISLLYTSLTQLPEFDNIRLDGIWSGEKLSNFLSKAKRLDQNLPA